MTPVVTIVISVLNGGTRLRETIESVGTQRGERAEVVVIDGGSRDGTVDLLESMSDQVDFWSSEPDAGIYDAWNKALEVARGEWIAFLGAGDVLVSGALQSVLSHVTAPGAGDLEFVSGRVQLCRSGSPIKVVG